MTTSATILVHHESGPRSATVLLDGDPDSLLRSLEHILKTGTGSILSRLARLVGDDHETWVELGAKRFVGKGLAGAESNVDYTYIVHPSKSVIEVFYGPFATGSPTPLFVATIGDNGSLIWDGRRDVRPSSPYVRVEPRTCPVQIDAICRPLVGGLLDRLLDPKPGEEYSAVWSIPGHSELGQFKVVTPKLRALYLPSNAARSTLGGLDLVGLRGESRSLNFRGGRFWLPILDTLGIRGETEAVGIIEYIVAQALLPREDLIGTIGVAIERTTHLILNDRGPRRERVFSVGGWDVAALWALTMLEWNCEAA